MGSFVHLELWNYKNRFRKMDLRKEAEEYFSSLNPIAARIYNDINQTKAAYEDLWNKLSPDEQEQIVNESIIKPKYK
ncbi:hypothetical protein HHI36_006637 [Cryptolaemus montrouzieri]|uniref:DUF4706 domain-containing protein n=1 Tax=Cryptolaemus montrouzieri TaxID=559131 RepID=A0ABD2NYR4_9CUCU